MKKIILIAASLVWMHVAQSQTTNTTKTVKDNSAIKHAVKDSTHSQKVVANEKRDLKQEENELRTKTAELKTAESKGDSTEIKKLRKEINRLRKDIREDRKEMMHDSAKDTSHSKMKRKSVGSREHAVPRDSVNYK